MSTESLENWFATPLGTYVLERESAYFDQTLADVFGFNAAQLGLPRRDFLRASRMPLRFVVAPEQGAQVRADFRELPLASGSVDLVLMPHVLEFSENPHQILREVERVLMPEGSVVITGFNPRSLWGARRLGTRRPRPTPWNGQFISLPRLKDWLALLGFEVAGGRLTCYAPPFGADQWRERFRFMEPAGDRWWPIAGGVYLLHAIKRVAAMRLLKPEWNARFKPKPRLASLTQRLDDTGRLAAREVSRRDAA
ncbi:MAG: class I SAM-dependent methyltransferase [Pseudomonadota bacterium]